jgi:hypothetical protein
MTDFNFVSTKSHQSDKFALHRVPRAGHVLARKALSLVSPSTHITSPPPEDRLRCWQQNHYSENFTLKQHAIGPRARCSVRTSHSRWGGVIHPCIPSMH